MSTNQPYHDVADLVEVPREVRDSYLAISAQLHAKGGDTHVHRHRTTPAPSGDSGNE